MERHIKYFLVVIIVNIENKYWTACINYLKILIEKTIFLMVVFISVANAGILEGIQSGIALHRATMSAEQAVQESRYQQEMILIKRENIRQQRLLTEARIREMNARAQEIRLRQNTQSSVQFKNNKPKYFITEKGTRFRVVYNKHGAILKSNSFTIYLGKSCDVSSAEFGVGRWKDGRHMGFSIQFNNSEIVFPRQQLLIKNNAKCI